MGCFSTKCVEKDRASEAGCFVSRLVQSRRSESNSVKDAKEKAKTQSTQIPLSCFVKLNFVICMPPLRQSGANILKHTAEFCVTIKRDARSCGVSPEH